MCFQHAASDLEAVGKQYPFEPFRWLPSGSSHVLRLNFEEAIKILQDNGFPEVTKPQLHSSLSNGLKYAWLALLPPSVCPDYYPGRHLSLVDIVAVSSRCAVLTTSAVGLLPGCDSPDCTPRAQAAHPARPTAIFASPPYVNSIWRGTLWQNLAHIALDARQA